MDIEHFFCTMSGPWRGWGQWFPKAPLRKGGGTGYETVWKEKMKVERKKTNGFRDGTTDWQERGIGDAKSPQGGDSRPTTWFWQRGLRPVNPFWDHSQHLLPAHRKAPQRAIRAQTGRALCWTWALEQMPHIITRNIYHFYSITPLHFLVPRENHETCSCSYCRDAAGPKGITRAKSTSWSTATWSPNEGYASALLSSTPPSPDDPQAGQYGLIQHPQIQLSCTCTVSDGACSESICLPTWHSFSFRPYLKPIFMN